MGRSGDPFRQPQPSLGFYGATHRLEENSTRRLAMGTTLAVSMLGSKLSAWSTGFMGWFGPRGLATRSQP